MQQPILWLTLLALVAVHAWINIRKASLPKQSTLQENEGPQARD
jgi:hypothetical protein